MKQDKVHLIEEALKFVTSQWKIKDAFERLKAISQFLGDKLNADYVMINQCHKQKPDFAQTLVVYKDKKFSENFEYRIDETPCQMVVNNNICVYESNIQKTFPKDLFLIELNMESYVGVPLWDSYGDPIGIIAVMFKNKISDGETIKIVIQSMANKVSQEIEKILSDGKFHTLYENHEIQNKKLIKLNLTLNEAQRLSHVGNWQWNMITDEATWSDEMYRIYGVTKEDFYPSNKNVTKTVVEEDLPKMAAAVEVLFKNQKFSPFEFRIKRPTGEIRTLQILALEIGASGSENENIIFGVTQDITEQKLAEDKIRESLKEKELLLRELYHRTKNNMQVISSMLSIQSIYSKDENSKEVFEDTKNRIMSMALVHEKLYQAKDLSRIDLKEYTSDLINLLVNSVGKKMGNIQIIKELNNVSVTLDTAIPCGQIINELFTNSLKHAFPKNQEGHIKIKLEKSIGNDILLSVSDNGVGVPENFDFKSCNSYGLLSVVSLVEHQLSGTIEMNTKSDTTFNIKFKDNSKMERI